VSARRNAPAAATTKLRNFMRKPPNRDDTV
jgi:hypothetical protein